MPGEVDNLRHAVLQHTEGTLGQRLDEAAVSILDRGFNHDTGDVGFFDDLKRFQHDGVANLAAQSVGDGNGDLSSLEWILVGPLDGIGRTVLVGPEKLAVDEESNGSQRGVALRANLRDYADAAGDAAPAERRRYPHRRAGSVAADRGGPTPGVRAGGRLHQESDERDPDEHVDHA